MQKIMFSDRRIKYPQKTHPRKDVRDLTGRKFGNLTVLSRHHIGYDRSELREVLDWLDEHNFEYR